MIYKKPARGYIANFIFTRLISCKSCGVELQTKDRNNGLKDLKYLLFSQDLQRIKQDVAVPLNSDVRKESTKINCKRCCDAIHRNHYLKEDFPKYSIDQVCEPIPEGSTVFHVVPLADFPLHLDKTILTDQRFNASLLLTKGDQLSPDKSLLQRKAPIFFKEFCKLYLGVESNKAVALSALKSWNMQSVYSVLSAKSYLIGSSNVGKSSLINALLKKYTGYKLLIGRKQGELTPPSGLEELVNCKDFLQSQVAGVSHIPNMTRAIQPYMIGEKVLHDLPGYSKVVNGVDLDTFIDKKLLDRIRKTDLFKKSKLVKQSYESVKGTEAGRCYTVSGLFYLVPPPGTVNQVVSYIPGEEKQYKNVDKALSVIADCYESSEAVPLRKYIGVSKEMSSKEAYVRHIIPPFQGTIEIALKEIGYLQLRCTGTYKFAGLHEIWVPKGIEVCIREPLVRLIERGFERSISSNGHLSSCPKDRAVFSSTYPMAFDESDTLAKMREMYLERTKRSIAAHKIVHTDPMEIIGKLHEDPLTCTGTTVGK